MSYLPSKKLRGVVLAVFVVAVIALLLNKVQIKEFNTNSDNLVFERSLDGGALSGVREKDSDGDGLKDWEETLWGTDLLNPDTDGDGTSDGDEIDQKRNPLVVGPDDDLNLSDEEIESLLEEDLTESEILARNFFAGYISLKQSGGLNQESIKGLIDSFSDGIELDDNVGYRFSQSDIKISGDNSKQAMANYINELVLKIQKNLSYSFFGNELIIVREALQTENRDLLKELKEAEIANKNLAQDLIGMSVPLSLLSIHLGIVNSYNALSRNFANIQNFFEDPIIAVADIKKYVNETSLLVGKLRDMQVFLKNNGIVENEELGIFVVQ